MNHKTAVITGGTGGIGLQTAIGLTKEGIEVIVTGRNEDRAQKAVDQISQSVENAKVSFVVGDVSTLAGCKALTKAICSQITKLDILINNAGCFAKTYSTNIDSFESGFAVNVVAPFAMTQGLLPILEKSNAARVINVTGGSQNRGLTLSNLQSEDHFDGLNTYSDTKRAMEALSIPIAKSLQKRGVYLNIVYPGQAATSMTRSLTASDLPWWMRPLWPIASHFMLKEDGGASARKASQSSIWTATSETLSNVSGRYFDTHCVEKPFHQSIQDIDVQHSVVKMAGFDALISK